MVDKYITPAMLGRAIERLKAQAATQVKVLNDSDTLPTDLPKGGVAIVVGQSNLTFYTEDGTEPTPPPRLNKISGASIVRTTTGGEEETFYLDLTGSDGKPWANGTTLAWTVDSFGAIATVEGSTATTGKKTVTGGSTTLTVTGGQTATTGYINLTATDDAGNGKATKRLNVMNTTA